VRNFEEQWTAEDAREFAKLPVSRQRAIIEAAVEEAVELGILRDTGRTKPGPDGRPSPVYQRTSKTEL
jgi:hypothetical protein